MNLTAIAYAGEYPGASYVAVEELLGATEGAGGCTGQTRLTWRSNGPVFAAIADLNAVDADAGDWSPIIAPGIEATEGAMILNECDVPAFANARGFLDADGNVDETVEDVTVAVTATTHQWNCIDEVYALPADERNNIAPDADCD